MFMAPLMFEIYSEQTRILAKIQMQMGLQGMQEPEQASNMRPFWFNIYSN